MESELYQGEDGYPTDLALTLIEETVFAVFDNNDHLVAIYKTEEGASKTCDELNALLGTKPDSTFLWSVGLNYYYKAFELIN